MPNHSKKCKCKCNKTPCRCSSEDLCEKMHQHLDNALQCMSQIDANETATEKLCHEHHAWPSSCETETTLELDKDGENPLNWFFTKTVKTSPDDLDTPEQQKTPEEEPSSTHDTTNPSDTSSTTKPTFIQKVEKLRKLMKEKTENFVKKHKLNLTHGSLLSTSELQDQRHSNPYLLVADDAELQRATDSWSVSAPTADPVNIREFEIRV